MTLEVEGRNSSLLESLRTLYENAGGRLTFHGWHHVYFVASKATEIAAYTGANVEICQSAGLTHDLNYMIDAKSRVEDGQGIRFRLLRDAGYSTEEVVAVEKAVVEGDTHNRRLNKTGLSIEAQTLSDADTLVKVLPVTPILFSRLYRKETGKSLRQMADDILRDQLPLFRAGNYFYSEYAWSKYQAWAASNIALWESVSASLEDEDVAEYIRLATAEGFLDEDA